MVSSTVIEANPLDKIGDCAFLMYYLLSTSSSRIINCCIKIKRRASFITHLYSTLNSRVGDSLQSSHFFRTNF